MKNLPYLSDEKLDQFIRAVLAEDIGPGDHSTLASIPAEREGSARLLIKDSGIIAGLELAKKIFQTYEPRLQVDLLLADGSEVQQGDIGLLVQGPAAAILSTERVVLNCLQRMSGIATKTHYFNSLIAHTKARVMDTRKTTPGFRMLEKWAVILGGGLNHRYALYDMVMLKDNHIDFAGGIEAAIRATQAYLKAENLQLKIEVETRTLGDVEEVLRVGGIDLIMLDNMDYPTMRRAVALIDGRFPVEASGGVTEKTLRDVAECGVDYISIGALTHHVKSMDISLKAC
ncbi:nicotinate-nucleotide pyrophosphorylase [Nitritalea halalkaliphila LW7]|uniref:Probable nicotinate-nucleotide pyrophosphorylase [carboxylating] n=1 Tax=Nitritalea halalkaliphila LW7 TaxID=1189621 RepID=I5BYV6_9BACT|nr:carboxylating nicotinate-nucleotide diphosphorylase [Nitritalea halalkaliphila]EIM74758.1 nicotinate-nucleotide pyrophosphorylase [Nitritalea halalkaliphila LW7]